MPVSLAEIRAGKLRPQPSPSVMDTSPGQAWQPEYEKEPPLEAPMFSPDDLIGSGLPTKAALAVKALVGGAKAAAPMLMAGAGVIKPKGGNWLSGRYGVEHQLSGLLKKSEAPEEAAINNWIDSKLVKYIKNELATPEDSVRLMLEKFPEEQAQKLAMTEARIEKLRAKQQAQAATRGVPEEYLTQTRQDILAAERARDLLQANTGMHFTPRPDYDTSWLGGKRHAQGFPSEGMGQSPIAKAWEEAADQSIFPREAGELAQGSNNLAVDPWLAKVPPQTQVYAPMHNPMQVSHLVDELRNSITEGRLAPEALAKMPVDQAVRHVAEINALRKVDADKIARASMEDMPVFKDYPEAGLSWRQLYSTDQNQLKKWLKQEGDAMAHCVGGYCPDVASGRSNIYSLRDTNGKPYVTIETKPNLIDMSEYTGNYTKGRMNQADAIEAIQRLSADPTVRLGDLSHWIKDIKDRKLGLPIVNQVKGPGNQSPDPKYFPQIQDFIKQGKWGEIRDLHHTGLDPLQIDQYFIE